MQARLKTLCGLESLVGAACLALAARGTAGDLVIARFGGTNYGDWQRTGTAFNPGPAPQALFGKLEIENSPDPAVASSEIEGDGPTGTLTSPEFKIARNYMSGHSRRDSGTDTTHSRLRGIFR